MVTSFPLRDILCNTEVTGTFARWAAKLDEFDVDFVLHHAMKSQDLVDFMAERTPSPGTPDEYA
jgi:hypothetical protein